MTYIIWLTKFFVEMFKFLVLGQFLFYIITDPCNQSCVAMYIISAKKL